MAQKLTVKAQGALAKLKGWSEVKGRDASPRIRIRRFQRGFGFMTRAALIAESSTTSRISMSTRSRMSSRPRCGG